MIGSFGRDRGNGILRSGEAALGGKRGTEFNGGGENGEAATGDCSGHLKHKAKAWSTSSSFSGVLSLFSLFSLILCAKLD